MTDQQVLAAAIELLSAIPDDPNAYLQAMIRLTPGTGPLKPGTPRDQATRQRLQYIIKRLSDMQVRLGPPPRPQTPPIGSAGSPTAEPPGVDSKPRPDGSST